MSTTRNHPLCHYLPLQPNFRFVVAKLVSVALVSCGIAATTQPAKAEAAVGSTLYQLNVDSSFMQGCFPPCQCPLMLGVPVKATFLLTPTGFDGLFNNYAVTAVTWIFSVNATNLFVTGSGTYKIGGEVGLQQELSLSLLLGGGSILTKFDSGVVAESVPFPNIKVSISMDGQVCFDRVFNLSASPVRVPQLQVKLAGNKIVLSWPVSVGTFVLQQASALTFTNWATVTNAPTVIGQQNQVVLSVSPGNRFYRLEPSGN